MSSASENEAGQVDEPLNFLSGSRKITYVCCPYERATCCGSQYCCQEGYSCVSRDDESWIYYYFHSGTVHCRWNMREAIKQKLTNIFKGTALWKWSNAIDG